MQPIVLPLNFQRLVFVQPAFKSIELVVAIHKMQRLAQPQIIQVSLDARLRPQVAWAEWGPVPYQFRSGLPYTMRTSGSIPEEFDTFGNPSIIGIGPGMNGSGGDNRLRDVF